jgi:hypothetical protein
MNKWMGTNGLLRLSSPHSFNRFNSFICIPHAYFYLVCTLFLHWILLWIVRNIELFLCEQILHTYVHKFFALSLYKFVQNKFEITFYFKDNATHHKARKELQSVKPTLSLNLQIWIKDLKQKEWENQLVFHLKHSW